ncbi:MAG TPA: glycosyltransferase family 4 protein [Gemmatimonadaceae bacterium]|nr:glycosyltransferase family 4 protein [Gemmatimonadaceae bacterium]
MLSYEYPPLGGGGAKVVDGLSAELVALGHRVDLVTMAYEDLPRREDVRGVQVHRVPCLRRRRDMSHPSELLSYVASALPRALRLTRQTRYDVLHAHFIFPDGIIAYALRKTTGMPYLITAHGSDVPGYNPDRFTLHHKLLAPLWHVVTANAAELVSPSEALQGLIRRANGHCPVTLIPNGVSLGRFQAGEPKQDRILMVTRMFERKGVQYALDALAGMDHGYRVSIVGDGPFLGELQQRAARLRLAVDFHGWLENDSRQLRDLFETSRIFLFPSEAENFPVVLLEAMAAGMAIITTRETGCAEVVGDAAVVVESRNTMQIREALRELTSDRERCAHLGQAARARLEDRYAWRTVANRYLDSYARLPAGGSSPAMT